jgi:hypothetical protein
MQIVISISIENRHRRIFSLFASATRWKAYPLNRYLHKIKGTARNRSHGGLIILIFYIYFGLIKLFSEEAWPTYVPLQPNFRMKNLMKIYIPNKRPNFTVFTVCLWLCQPVWTENSGNMAIETTTTYVTASVPEWKGLDRQTPTHPQMIINHYILSGRTDCSHESVK